MLSPIEDRTEPGSQDIYLVYEAHPSYGDSVITIVVSIKPRFREWRAYWRASTSPSAELRFETCRGHGDKLDEDVARAMFPQVEERYGVTWRL